jgi:hypothetical protein
MGQANWTALLRTFMDRADKVGVTGRRFVLCFLAVIAAIMMIWGVSPVWGIAFVVIIYILEPVVEIARMLVFQRRADTDLENSRTEFRQFMGRKRHRLKGSEPELPLLAPKQRRTDKPGEGQ